MVHVLIFLKIDTIDFPVGIHVCFCTIISVIVKLKYYTKIIKNLNNTFY